MQGAPHGLHEASSVWPCRHREFPILQVIFNMQIGEIQRLNFLFGVVMFYSVKSE